MSNVAGTAHSPGRLASAMRVLQTSGTAAVISLLPWKCILNRWSNVHSQQDAAEFFWPVCCDTHSLRPTRAHGKQGSHVMCPWFTPQFRTQVSYAPCWDLKLQARLYNIASTAGTHKHMFMHIVRLLCCCSCSSGESNYSESDSRAVKLRTDVRTQVDEVVRLPCYLNSAESSTYMQKYQVVGFVYHIGDSLKARHYKAALRCFEQSRCGSLLEVLPN